MRYKRLWAIAVVFIGPMMLSACATVKVQTPEEPIKLDISVRMDIYQHVQKDIDNIEDMVRSDGGRVSFLEGIFFKTAFCAELPDAISKAVESRKERLPLITRLLKERIIGEKKDGLLEIMVEDIDDEDMQAVLEENNDRLTIYEEIANKNGISIDEVQAMYSERLINDAPVGSLIQKEVNGKAAWVEKE